MLRHLRSVGALMVSVTSETLWKWSRDGNSMNQTAKWIEMVDLVGTCWNNLWMSLHYTAHFEIRTCLRVCVCLVYLEDQDGPSLGLQPNGPN